MRIGTYPLKLKMIPREKYEAVKMILDTSEIERFNTETMVATQDPIFTAYLYTGLKALTQWIVSKYHQKSASKIVIGANFEQITFQSVGECMISIKLSKTIREIRKLK